jgi:hypothetical protein
VDTREGNTVRAAHNPSLSKRKAKLVGDLTAEKAFNRLPCGLAWQNTRLALRGNDE